MSNTPHLGRRAPDYNLARQIAAKTLNENNFSDPPVLPKALAENYGLSVLFADFPDNLSDVMGFIDFEDNSIFVNRANARNRQTFTIAHELGHALMHRDYIEAHPAEYKVLRRQPMGGTKDPIEQEANAFASYLLVPTNMLDRYKTVATASELARLFAVSEDVIRWRLWNEYRADARSA